MSQKASHKLASLARFAGPLPWLEGDPGFMRVRGVKYVVPLRSRLDLNHGCETLSFDLESTKTERQNSTCTDFETEPLAEQALPFRQIHVRDTLLGIGDWTMPRSEVESFNGSTTRVPALAPDQAQTSLSVEIGRLPLMATAGPSLQRPVPNRSEANESREQDSHICATRAHGDLSIPSIEGLHAIDDLIFRVWVNLTSPTGRRCHNPQESENPKQNESDGSNQTQSNEQKGSTKRKLTSRNHQGNEDGEDSEDTGNGPPHKHLKKAATAGKPMYACLICKGNPKLGYDTPCEDFQTANIEEVLRHLIRIHLPPGHVDKSTIAEVKSLWHSTKPADRGPTLWKQAFTIIYPKIQRVPHPYRPSFEESRQNLDYRGFANQMRNNLRGDPNVGIALMEYLDDCERSNVERDQQLCRLRQGHETNLTLLAAELADKRSQLEAQFEHAQRSIYDSNRQRLETLGRDLKKKCDFTVAIAPEETYVPTSLPSAGIQDYVTQSTPQASPSVRGIPQEQYSNPIFPRPSTSAVNTSSSPVQTLTYSDRSSTQPLLEPSSANNFPRTPSMGYNAIDPQLLSSHPSSSQGPAAYPDEALLFSEFPPDDYCISPGCKAIRTLSGSLCHAHADEVGWAPHQ